MSEEYGFRNKYDTTHQTQFDVDVPMKKWGQQKVGAGGTAVTREMLTAAHGVTLESGDVVLSARLLERIYLAMDAAR